MSIAAIPSLFSAAAASAASSASNAPTPQPQQAAPPPPTTSAYTVQLTEAQQVYQLYNEGVQVPQIATNLSLPLAVVNSYLNLSSSGS